MKKAKSTAWSVLIYTLFLINIAMIFALVVFNIAWVVLNNSEYQNISRKLSNNILYKWNLSLKYLTSLNTNGGWFTDDISCPTSVTMSWNTLSWTVVTSQVISWEDTYCAGTYNSNSLYLYFNSDYTAFTGAEYQWSQIIVSGWVWTTNFSTDNTSLSFSTSWLWGVDDIDDDLDSDNYKVNSTGTTDYPNSYQDDDVLPRRTMYFYLPPDSGFVNIFFNNQQTANFIAWNPNNSDLLNKNIWDVSSARVYLDIDKDFWIKVVRFSKARFDASNELIALDSLSTENNYAGIGFIQDSGTVSTWWLTPTGSEYDFDFTNNYYAIFLKNYSTGTLLFQMRAYTSTGAWIYINPIDDSDSTVTRYLWNDIIIDSEGRYIYNQFEIVWLK